MRSRGGTRAVARSLRFSEAELEALRREDPHSLSQDEAIVARTVVALLDGDLDDEQWDAAKHELGLTAVFELTTLVGYYSTLALQLRVFRVVSIAGPRAQTDTVSHYESRPNE